MVYLGNEDPKGEVELLDRLVRRNLTYLTLPWPPRLSVLSGTTANCS
jgi:hypothetical protein